MVILPRDQRWRGMYTAMEVPSATQNQTYSPANCSPVYLSPIQHQYYKVSYVSDLAGWD